MYPPLFYWQDWIFFFRENQKFIFDRFKRVDSDLAIQEGGLGLGLAITKAYVELLGQWGMLIMSFYFGGRTLEKIMEIKKW